MATTPVTTSRKPLLDSTNEYLGRSDSMEFGVVQTSVAEIIDNPVTLADVELEAFMNEPVMVTVMSSGKDNEPIFVQTSVNGITQIFKRDVPIVVKRKYVERLARAKETGISQTVDAALGESMNKLTQSHSMRYPFSVNRDDNPRGGAWLRAVLAS